MALKYTRIRRDGHLPITTVVSPEHKAHLEELRTELAGEGKQLTMSETVAFIIELGLEEYDKAY